MCFLWQSKNEEEEEAGFQTRLALEMKTAASGFSC